MRKWSFIIASISKEKTKTDWDVIKIPVIFALKIRNKFFRYLPNDLAEMAAGRPATDLAGDGPANGYGWLTKDSWAKGPTVGSWTIPESGPTVGIEFTGATSAGTWWPTTGFAPNLPCRISAAGFDWATCCWPWPLTLRTNAANKTNTYRDK